VQAVYAIKLAGMLAPLRPGETLLGRGSDCDVVVPSEKASRLHAKIIVESGTVWVEDLQSTNGVFVNDEPVVGRAQLRLRDAIRIGDTTMRVVHFDDMKRTHRGDALELPGDSLPEAFHRVSTDPAPAPNSFEVVGPLVDKMLTLGRIEEAERLVSAPFERLIADVEQGSPVAPEVTEAAASFAVKLAQASGNARWVDRIIRVHASIGRLLPLAVVDDLYRVLRRARGVDLVALRRYAEQLEAGAAGHGPTERFTVKRIAGLCQVASG
jgi:hypothetical protein